MLCSQASLCSGLNSHPSRKRWVFTPLLQPCLTPPFLSLCFPPSWFYSLAPTPSFFHSPSSHRHPSFLCFAALLSSHFPPPPSLSPSLRCWSIHSLPGRCEKSPPSSSPIHPQPPLPLQPWMDHLSDHSSLDFFFFLGYREWGVQVMIMMPMILFSSCSSVSPVLLFHFIMSLPLSAKVSATPLAHLK